MSKLKLVALFGITVDIAALYVYFVSKAEKCTVPVLSMENAIILFGFTLMASGGFWLVTLAENKNFVQTAENNEITGLRGIINSAQFAYYLLATVGILGIYVIAFAAIKDTL